MSMTRSWIIGLCATVLAGAAGAAETTTDGWKTYRNARFGYELSYPADMAYTAHGDGAGGELKDARTGHGLVDFEVWPPGECPRQPAGANARAVGIERAITITQADGPDGSSYCGDPMTVHGSTGMHGAAIYELELTCARESYADADADAVDGESGDAPTETPPVMTPEGKKGPTYFVDISTPWRKRILTADPVGVDPRKQETNRKIDLAMLRAVLGTLKTFPIQQPPGVCIEDLRNRGSSAGIRPH